MITQSKAALLALSVLSILVYFILYGIIGWKSVDSRADVILPVEAPKKHGTGWIEVDSIEILLLGTSITANGDWPGQLEAALSSCSDRPVKVSRLAQAGATSNWGILALKQLQSDFHVEQPDVVIFEFSINDSSLLRGLPLPVSRRNTLELIQVIRSKGAVPILATMNPSWGVNFLERPGQARYQATYRELAMKTGAGLIDSIPDWKSLPSIERRHLVPDGLHPTSSGMKKVVLPRFLLALSPLACQ